MKRRYITAMAAIIGYEEPTPEQKAAAEAEEARKKAASAGQFTQDQVNAMIAKEKGRWQQQNAATIKQLETLQQNANLTQQQKDELEIQLTELKNQSLTKEELASQEREKLTKKLKDTETSLTKDRDGWRGRFETAQISRDIVDAASAGKAIRSTQVLTLIRGQSRLVEKLDEQGKGTGEYETKVKLETKGSDGKPVTLDLSPKDAITKMREDVENFGNLFESDAVGGVGRTNVPGRSSNPNDLSKLSMEEYMKQRQAARK